jgi:phosphatidate phosphatase PAH1
MTLANSLPNFEDAKVEGGRVLLEAKKVNPLLSASYENIERFIDSFFPKLSQSTKHQIISTISIGMNNLPSTSAWKSDAFLALHR